MNTKISRRDLMLTGAAMGAGLCSAAVARGQDRKLRIKIGQIGVGHAHATKLGVYRESADYEVVGLVEPDKVLRERAREQPAFRDVPVMSEEQLLSTPGLAAV